MCRRTRAISRWILTGDGGWEKNRDEEAAKGCRHLRPVTCGNEFAREGTQRESDRHVSLLWSSGF